MSLFEYIQYLLGPGWSIDTQLATHEMIEVTWKGYHNRTIDDHLAKRIVGAIKIATMRKINR